MKVLKICSFIHYLKDDDGYKDCYMRRVGRLTKKKARELVAAIAPTAVLVDVIYKKQEITIPDEIVNEMAEFADYNKKEN